MSQSELLGWAIDLPVSAKLRSTRAVETILISAPDWDSIGLKLGPAHWERAVRESGYVAAQQTVRRAT